MNFKVDELKRLYYDLMFIDGLKLEEIAALREKAKHLYPDLNSYHYLEFEEEISNHIKRYVDYITFLKD